MRLALAIVIYLTLHFIFRHFITGRTRVLADLSGVVIIVTFLFVAFLLNEAGVQRPVNFRHPMRYAEEFQTPDQAMEEYWRMIPQMSFHYLPTDRKLLPGKISYDTDSIDFMTYIRNTFNIFYEGDNDNVWPYYNVSITPGSSFNIKKGSVDVHDLNLEDGKGFSYIAGDYSEPKHDIIILPSFFMRHLALHEYETVSAFDYSEIETNDLYDTSLIAVQSQKTESVDILHY